MLTCTKIFIHSGYLSTIKSTNKLIHTLAVSMRENALDNCILLNERKGAVEIAPMPIFFGKGRLGEDSLTF